MNGPHEWQPTGARDGGKRCRLCGLTNLQVKDKDQCPKAAPLKFCDDAPVSYQDMPPFDSTTNRVPSNLLAYEERIRAIAVDEVLAKVEVGDAPFTALSKFASKAAADVARWKARAEAAEAELGIASGQPHAPDAVARLVEAASQARLALAGYVSSQSAIDKLDEALAAMETSHD